MPRQAEDTTSTLKRRRSPASATPNPAEDAAAGSSTPHSQRDNGRPPFRKRVRESDAPRPTNRTRSPLTSNRRDRQADPSPPRSPPPAASQPRKRPGAGARLDPSARAAAQAAQQAREAEERKLVEGRGAAADLVSSHYNAVPQRGREWRRTDSSIKGLRSFNNWVKSAVIQKCSVPEALLASDNPEQPLRVLDLGCGKGGDLMKWYAAPNTPDLYVGIDPAAVSVTQAKERFEGMRRNGRRMRSGRPAPPFHGEFYVRDCFGESLASVRTVQEVGFDPNAGPGAGPIGARHGRGGFDVVSIMFALHYSYENEERARGLLKNVAGALKKGGKFVGVMPNSDVLSAHVEKHLKLHLKGQKGEDKKKATNGEEKDMYDDGWDPEKPNDDHKDDGDGWDPEKGGDDDDWDPEKGSGDDEAWDPEKSGEAAEEAAGDKAANGATPVGASLNGNHAKTPLDLPPLEWGNSIYRVKFTQDRPLPTDGVFRPPYGWKYFFYLEEAVDVPEYVVPWEGFRALAEEYGLELQFRKSFSEVWEEYRDDRELRIVAERMHVTDRSGRLAVSAEEMEAASFYHAFCFYKI